MKEQCAIIGIAAGLAPLSFFKGEEEGKRRHRHREIGWADVEGYFPVSGKERNKGS